MAISIFFSNFHSKQGGLGVGGLSEGDAWNRMEPKPCLNPEKINLQSEDD